MHIAYLLLGLDGQTPNFPQRFTQAPDRRRKQP
jgi:hypothetical protein